MNNMKRQSEKQLLDLSESIGDFIRYWGFRRIHGQIWTQVYLSSIALSGADLAQRLNVSKALISPALQELQDYKLILCQAEDGKTKRYSANPNVFGVIKEILLEREVKLLTKIEANFQTLKASEPEHLSNDRLQKMDLMIQSAVGAASFIIAQINDEDL